MIKIVFKNVDQGDSIILEWENDSGANKIAIIDCALKQDKTNPVLNHIISHEISEIELIILSHPHLDHFSGLLKLLEYCNENNIKIKYFIHSCFQVVSYIKSAIPTNNEKHELHSIFTLIRKLRDKKELQFGYLDANPYFAFPLTGDIKLTFLSPTSIETDKYIRGESFYHNEEENGSHPNSNWLSSIIRIGTDEWYALLTSDAQKYSLKRIDKKQPESLKGKLVLGQSPHHGSFHNHNGTFWKKRERVERPPIVFSVGKNGFKHPGEDVVSFFRVNNFTIHSTNKVGGINSIPQNEAVLKTSRYLDLFSSISSSNSGSSFQGDQEFTFDYQGKLMKP